MYSALDGYDKISELVEEVARLGQPAVAVTDHGTLAGIYDLYKQAKAKDINPIAGIEFYVTPSTSNRHARQAANLGDGGRDDVAGGGAYTHLTVLAENNIGLKNLFRLNLLASTEGFYKKPRVDLELLAEYSEGLIATTGCPSGEVQVWLRMGRFDKALEYAAKLVDIFGKDSVFVELMDHGMKGDLERKVRGGLLDIAAKLNIPVVATNDLHYARAKDAPAHERMLAIQTRSVMSELPDYEGGKRFAFEGGSYYVKSAAEMAQLFPDHPEALKSTMVIAERASFSVEPDDTLRPKIDFPEGYTEEEWLTKQAFDGLAKRLPDKITDPEYIDRLKTELHVLNTKGYAGYFLVVSDFVRWGKFVAQPPVPTGMGRGSAAGSLVAFCLDITDADPIRFDLLFERFINPERDSPPDIDMDFNDSDRERVVQYVREKYGDDYVALVTTLGTMKAKSAIKDMVRILEHPFSLGNDLTKALPEPVFGKEAALWAMFDPEGPRYDEGGPFRDKVLELGAQEIVKNAIELEGRIRSYGVHAAAVVISSEPVVDTVPVYMRQADGVKITQWDYPTAEEIGLLKVDFLGLRNLGVIAEAIKHVKRTRGVDINLMELILGPMDDQKTYDLLAKGESLGVFQLDGGGMRSLMKMLKPDKFDDISALLSLYRPGPMGVNAHTDFALRKNGLQEVTPIHPELAEPLKDILGETYQLVIYQEQVMRIAQKVAGYTLAQADLLRRAMGKKKRYIIDAEFVPFSAGMKANGYSDAAIKTLWDILVPFSDYAFNKCITGDALVTLKDGSRVSIADLYAAWTTKAGEYELSAIADGHFTHDRVVDVVQNGVKNVYEMTLKNGFSITSTMDHRHLTLEGWKQLKDIKLGDLIATNNNPDSSKISYVGVASIEAAGEQMTYDIEMAGNEHNYLANGIVTHNSHTVGYGLISYATAYLKAHYPAEYMAALLSSVTEKKDKTTEYLEECRRMGLIVSVPDVNKAEIDYAPTSPTEITFGFKAIRGVGEGVAAHIVEERKANGRFKDFGDFLERSDKTTGNKRVIEGLTYGGGFDSLDLSRRAIIEGLEFAMNTLKKRRNAKPKNESQVSLFDDLFLEVEPISLPAMPEYPRLDKLKVEREFLGLYLSGHPLEGLDLSRASDSKPIADFIGDDPVIKPVEGWGNGKSFAITGIVTSLAVRRTRKGDMMASGVVEDKSGSIEFTVFPKAFEKVGSFLKLDGVFTFFGYSKAREEELSFLVDSLRPEEFSASGGNTLRVKVTALQWKASRPMFEKLLGRHPAEGGSELADVIVSVRDTDHVITEEVLSLPVKVSDALVSEVRALYGNLAIGRWLPDGVKPVVEGEPARVITPDSDDAW